MWRSGHSRIPCRCLLVVPAEDGSTPRLTSSHGTTSHSGAFATAGGEGQVTTNYDTCGKSQHCKRKEGPYVWNSSFHGTKSLQKFRKAVCTDITSVSTVQDSPQVIFVFFRYCHVISFHCPGQPTQKSVPFHVVLLRGKKVNIQRSEERAHQNTLQK